MNPRISESIAQSIAAKQDILTDGDFLARIEKAADMITASLKGAQEAIINDLVRKWQI